MIKSTSWFVCKQLSEDDEEVLETFTSRDYAEDYAGILANEYPGEPFLVIGNNASSPCWMSW